MEQQEQIQVSILLVEVRLRQVVEQEIKEIRIRKAMEVDFQQVVMAAKEVRAEEAVVEQQEAEQMVAFLLLEQAEQELLSRFLATTEEVRNHMVQVVMAQQILLLQILFTPLEQPVQ
jgi:hypothetical protein